MGIVKSCGGEMVVEREEVRIVVKRVLICQGSCGKEVDEVCGDGFCRDCHKSISWESCLNGTWRTEHLAF